MKDFAHFDREVLHSIPSGFTSHSLDVSSLLATTPHFVSFPLPTSSLPHQYSSASSTSTSDSGSGSSSGSGSASASASASGTSPFSFYRGTRHAFAKILAINYAGRRGEINDQPSLPLAFLTSPEPHRTSTPMCGSSQWAPVAVAVAGHLLCHPHFLSLFFSLSVVLVLPLLASPRADQRCGVAVLRSEESRL